MRLQFHSCALFHNRRIKNEPTHRHEQRRNKKGIRDIERTQAGVLDRIKKFENHIWLVIDLIGDVSSHLMVVLFGIPKEIILALVVGFLWKDLAVRRLIPLVRGEDSLDVCFPRVWV